MRSPGFTIVSGEIDGDERKPVDWSVEGNYESTRDGSWSGKGEVSFTFKPLPALSIRVGPEFTSGSPRSSTSGPWRTRP